MPPATPQYGVLSATDVATIFQQMGASHLHHANTIATSCTFLSQGALLSRQYVQVNGLVQTPQISDALDQQVGIWDCIFLDHVDIHHRRKSPNFYGPALFQFAVGTILGNLPAGTTMLLTKSNPLGPGNQPNWYVGQPDSDRWYRDLAEALSDISSGNLRFGNFKNMLVLRTPTGRFDFPANIADVVLDEPHRNITNGTDGFAHGSARLTAAAAGSGVTLTLGPHSCQYACTCRTHYANYVQQYVDGLFA